jgi:hypothetical protein
MGRVVLSNGVKQIHKCHLLNERLHQAVQLYQDKKPSGVKKLSLTAVTARFLGVTVTTLLCHVKPGHVSMTAFNAWKQKIRPPEERVLLNTALEASDLDLPWNRNKLTFKADTILKAREGNSFAPVGKYWVQGFLDCHHNELQMAWSCPLAS